MPIWANGWLGTQGRALSKSCSVAWRECKAYGRLGEGGASKRCRGRQLEASPPPASVAAPQHAQRRANTKAWALASQEAIRGALGVRALAPSV